MQSVAKRSDLKLRHKTIHARLPVIIGIFYWFEKSPKYAFSAINMINYG